ncbi:hypothetical protein [Methylocella silvestris]|uniref:hypothetical protein n=1 Tax=Methylocella silvestris TaxID=199596 RepID=UPI00017233E0|nr:hypothetical protein [Methylocella silvestris]
MVPACSIKAGRGHRVPLFHTAMAVLAATAAKRSDANDAGAYVFPGQRAGKPLSNMAMEILLCRQKQDATVHGFRSSF